MRGNRMKWFRKLKEAIRISKEKGIAMKRRLQIYFLFMAAIMFMLILIAFYAIGSFKSVDEKTEVMLRGYLGNFTQSIKMDFSNLSAQGIAMSNKISDKIDEFLENNNISFSDLTDNGDLIYGLESELYDTLNTQLLISNSSGAYIILNTTINSSLENASDLRSGLYLRIANINTQNPVNPEICLFRGIPNVGRSNNIYFHNQWDMEFNIERVPHFDELIKMNGRNPYENYYFSDAVKVNNTWEDIIVLCVPVTGENDEVYGICGFELSKAFFKLRYVYSSGELSSISGILARGDEKTIYSETGMESGMDNGYFANITGINYDVTKGAYFDSYTNGNNKYIGVSETIELSPVKFPGEDEWKCVVLMPKSIYENQVFTSRVKILAVCTAFLIIGFVLSFLLSKHYVDPILEGLETIRSRNGEKIKIPEIDDLMVFLTAEDEKEAKPVESEAHSTATFEAFVENISSLSSAERAVFDLYLEGLTAKEIAERLCLSINTIKTHNKKIYMKLNVSSLKELMVFIQMMKETGKI